MNIKKTLCSIVTSLIIATNSYGSLNPPKGYNFFDKANYYRFNRDITVTKISKNKRIGWFVYDARNKQTIGDEESEVGDYKKYSTMAEANRIIDSLAPEDVREMASLYRKGLAGYEIVYKIPNFIIEEGSKLEGILLRRYVGGGKDLPENIQKEIVKEIINNEKKEIIDEFYKKIFGDEKELNPLEAAEKVREYLLNTVEARILNASIKLDHAAGILERGRKNELSYEEYNEFLNDFIEGNCTGRAYLNAIDKIKKNVNWGSITQKIAKNLADGLGIKSSIENVSMHTNDLLDIDLASIVFGDKDFMDVFNDIERNYMEERKKLFKNIEEKYNLKEGSISRQIITDLRIKDISNKKNDREQIMDLIKINFRMFETGDISLLDKIVDKDATPAYYEAGKLVINKIHEHCKNVKLELIDIKIDIHDDNAFAIIKEITRMDDKSNMMKCYDAYFVTKVNFTKKNKSWKVSNSESLESKIIDKK